MSDPDIQRWKDLTERQLPERARQQHWPLQFDHCFKRVTLDAVFGDVWYNHLRAPAEANLSNAQARKAVAAAQSILQGGRAVLVQLNRDSLRWRGKSSQASKGE